MDIDLKWLAGLDKHELYNENGVWLDSSDESGVSSRKSSKRERSYISQSKLVEEIPPAIRGGLSTEARKKREEHSKRRKLQTQRKLEESKRPSAQRLTKLGSVSNRKQHSSADPKRRGAVGKPVMIKYINSVDSITLSYPKGFDYPLKPSSLKSHPTKQRTCVVCGNARKYDCSKTKKALCSLKCYRANLVTSQSS